ncbi:MAG: 2-oxoglutarate dehydrogenase E1 component [Flavobacteriales bacterium]|nr:2-oxoglutarate dehydrogenase E1 component [Flavobacteriales bacterium]
MDKQSYVGNSDVSAIDSLYQQYKQNPESVDISWQRFFEGFEFRQTEFEALPGGSSGNVVSGEMAKEFKVINLINAYRQRGHLFTETNPVRQRRKHTPTLDLEHFGLVESDLEITFQAGAEVGLGPAKLRDIIQHLKDCYCKHIGIEYMYVRDPQRVLWLRERIEQVNKPKFNAEEKKQFLEMASKASLFEQYVHRKFVGAKRFSVEGCEAVVPAMDYIVRHGGDMGVKEFVIGMAHRGRLNVLTNIMGKPQEQVFAEFEGLEYDEESNFDGDVKYHYGYSNDITTANGNEVHLTLCPNPSHLEAVNPVVEGLSRAKIDHYLNSEDKIVPVLVHGDAAVAGQGIVYEVVQMALLDGYRTGGTIHIVTNNQVGFTTNYLDARSSTYCTDVAKTTLCPVFHVNADDVEAVIETMKIALEYRMRFHMDVFVDLLGYRKYGHNEGDEPKFTQPTLYKLIASHPSLREIYLKQLIAEGTVDEAYGDQVKKSFESMLDTKLEIAKTMKVAQVKHFLEETWKNIRKATTDDFEKSPDTGFDKKKLTALAKKISTLPEGEKIFAKTAKVFADRLKMIEDDKLDWAMGELLAYATLLEERHPVRVSGQDVERGTFSHRHAVVKTDEDHEKEFILLNQISDKQAKFSVFNSLLSEYGVLGFDYGYAFGTPNGLTIWEAQFGDFNNGAQIIIDQFISAAEDKWRTMNGITMLLPHGYEGQGSEHSSGRLERFLQLCAENNMQICNCTTPANFYHLLRRQVKTDYRKPLVVFTPKKLLRYPKAVSSLDDMAKGRFQELIDDSNINKKEVDTVVFCSGKVYYDILEYKEKNGIGGNMAVVRLEQLYPLPETQIRKVISSYGKNVKLIWAQEEPENMGGWSYILRMLRDLAFDVVSLPASASPATGSPKVHEKRTGEMMSKLFSYSGVKA